MVIWPLVGFKKELISGRTAEDMGRRKPCGKPQGKGK